MKPGKTYYFKAVREKSKLLYRLLIAFLIIQGGFALLLYQATPFYLFGMYARPAEVQTEFPIYVLKVNRDTFNLPIYRDHQRMAYEYTILRYDEYTANGNKDPFEVKTRTKLQRLNLPNYFFSRIYNNPEEIQAYPLWLKRYMEKNLGKAVDSLRVDKIWIHFEPSGRVKADSTLNLIKE